MQNEKMGIQFVTPNTAQEPAMAAVKVLGLSRSASTI